MASSANSENKYVMSKVGRKQSAAENGANHKRRESMRASRSEMAAG
jgi:hypothetical protein